MDIKDLKSKLDNKEIIELHNGDDWVFVFKSKITKDYLFVFNSKPLFGYKTFSVFAKKANEKILQHSLIESN